MPKRGIKKRILNKVSALFSIRGTKHRLAIRSEHKKPDRNSPNGTDINKMHGVLRSQTPSANKPRGIRFSKRAVQRSKYLREKFGVRKTVMGFSPRVGSIIEEDENEITLCMLAENAENVIADSMAWLRNSKECCEQPGVNQVSHEKILQLWIENNSFDSLCDEEEDEYDDDDGHYSDEQHGIKQEEDDDQDSSSFDYDDDSDDSDDSDEQTKLAEVDNQCNDDDNYHDQEYNYDKSFDKSQQQPNVSNDYDNESEDDADEKAAHHMDDNDDVSNSDSMENDGYELADDNNNNIDITRNRIIYIDGKNPDDHDNDAERGDDDDSTSSPKDDDDDDCVMAETINDDNIPSNPKNNHKDLNGYSNRNNETHMLSISTNFLSPIDKFSNTDKHIDIDFTKETIQSLDSAGEDFENSFGKTKDGNNVVSMCNECDCKVERGPILNSKPDDKDYDNTDARDTSLSDSQHYGDDDSKDNNHNDYITAGVNLFTGHNVRSSVPRDNHNLKYLNGEIHQEQCASTEILPNNQNETKSIIIADMETQHETISNGGVLVTVNEEIDRVLSRISQIENDFNSMRETMNGFRSSDKKNNTTIQ